MARMLYLRDIEVDVHVRCRACGHEGVLPRADMNRRFGPNYPVLSIAPHYRCSRCSSRDTESRPAPPPYSTPVTAMAAQEEVPSFAGPLAALQGLLDAARSRGGPVAEPETDEPETEAARAPAAGRVEPAAPGLNLDLDLDLELERLAAEGGSAPEPGRRPLWEPVSLADLAGHDDETGTEKDRDEQDWDDEDWSPPNWALLDRDADGEPGRDEDIPPPPGPAARTSRPTADDPDDDASRSFNRTIAALRSILDGRPDDRGDDARVEDAPPPPPLPSPSPPVFSIKDAVAVPEDDEPEDDESDDAEPSNDDILAFAIRDPDKGPPLRERDPVPAAHTPAAHTPVGNEPLDRTIAALRSMVQKAAADRDGDEDDGLAGDEEEGRKGGVVTPLFGRSRKPVFDAETDDDPDEDESEERKAEADDAFWNRVDAEEDGAAKGGAPVIRKSTQEQEMEEALRALRALVEAESDLDDPPRPETDAAPGFKPLPRREPDLEPEADGADEPLDLMETFPASEPEKSKPGDGKRAEGKGSEGSGSGKKAAKDDSGALGKTLAALRNMLELDGKQGR